VSDFLEDVTRAFGGLIAKGALALASHRHDAAMFGNAIVVLAGGDVRIRLVRDRGDVFADAASAQSAEDWAPLERVLEAVGAPDPPPEGAMTTMRAAALVERHVAALAAGLAPARADTTRGRLAELARARTAEALRNFKRP